MRKIAYLSMDVNARHIVMGDMDGNGKYRGKRPFAPSENNIISALKAVKAKIKYLIIEAGPLAQPRRWALASSPRNTRVCLRVETRPRLDPCPPQADKNQNPIFEMASS